MTTRRRTLRTVMAACPLLLAGCVGIPDSGPVRAGYQLDPQQEPALIAFRPAGPRPGDTPHQVVDGFIEAMQAYPPTTLVARQFLTPKAAIGWRPEARTLVYGDRVTNQLRRDRVRLEATQLGNLSSRGSWTSARYGGRDVSHGFRLERVRGQWRIANPPVGILVSQAHFERYYRPYSLYFLDPTRDILVPDPVYLPDAPQTPTLLVQGLLRGPTRWLDGVVETLVPVATEVDLSVPVSSGGVADVALSDEALTLRPGERQLLLAQLVWTLRQVPAITGVRVLVGGSYLEIPGSSGVVPIEALRGFDPAAGLVASQELFGLRRDRLVTVGGSEVRPVPGPLGTGRLPFARPAVEVDGERAAVVSNRGRSVLISGIQLAGTNGPARPVRWYTGTRVRQLSWDTTSRLWIVDDTKRGAQVIVADGRGKPMNVRVDGVTGEEVPALRVARDGVRLAAVVGSGRSAQLLIGRIDRSANGDVNAVGHVRPVENPLARFSDIVDVAWTSPTTVVVLARTGKAPLQPYDVAIDGSSVTESLPLPDADATSVAAAPSSDLPIVVGTAAHRLWVRQPDLRWTRIGDNGPIRSPVYPG